MDCFIWKKERNGCQENWKRQRKAGTGQRTTERIRQKAAEELKDAIIGSLEELNFLHVEFAIRFERRNHYSGNGYDDVCFMISTNPGEPLRPLDKVVSGGELSRIMLAVKTLMADKDDKEVLVFDEIDTGISGRTAQKVSEKMA